MCFLCFIIYTYIKIWIANTTRDWDFFPSSSHLCYVMIFYVSCNAATHSSSCSTHFCLTKYESMIDIQSTEQKYLSRTCPIFYIFNITEVLTKTVSAGYSTFSSRICLSPRYPRTLGSLLAKIQLVLSRGAAEMAFWISSEITNVKRAFMVC